MNFYQVTKRIIDILGSIFFIILFSPIMIITAIHIKRVSPEGPILADIPLRRGKDDKEFRFYKFRSMIPNATQWLLDHPDLHEKYKQNNYKIEASEDPRVISGGVFMRKYSIDELPQFFNVLIGDMSLVGPRAYYPYELKEQLEKYPEAEKYVSILTTVKPGITGTWQVNGRSEINFITRVQMDADYARKNSLLYDIWVLLQTPYVVLTKKGAK
jgi:lipopolysaccharide/colanic/teichoic acid biosynthesis glycosyltransferase